VIFRSTWVRCAADLVTGIHAEPIAIGEERIGPVGILAAFVLLLLAVTEAHIPEAQAELGKSYVDWVVVKVAVAGIFPDDISELRHEGSVGEIVVVLKGILVVEEDRILRNTIFNVLLAW
jgi:hypothetical protein